MTINEGIRVQEVKTCQLCEASGLLLYSSVRDRIFDAPGVWGFLRCPNCGLVWLNPQPISQDIDKIYCNYSTHEFSRGKARRDRLQGWIAPVIVAATLGYNDVINLGSGRKSVGRILNLVPPLRDIGQSYVMFLNGRQRGKLLDVGCGNGTYLNRMQSLGWEVAGVEPDLEAATVAQRQYGLKVFVGTLEQAHFPPESFDAITMGHVIEHVPDPLSLLQECYRILKPEGKLIMMTPNCESLGHKIFKSSWRPLEPPRHFYLFSLQTMGELIQRTDFDTKILRTVSNSAVWIWGVSKLVQRNGRWAGGRLPARQLIEGVLFWMLEEVIALWKKVGEEILLVATKSTGRDD